MFDIDKEKSFTPKDIESKPIILDKGEDKKESIEVKEERLIPKGPFILRMKVLKEGNYRLDGVLYHLLPGDYFDGANLKAKKREILVNTKFIIME